MKIPISTFTNNPHSYLKQGVFTLTKRGEEFLRVTIEPLNGGFSDERTPSKLSMKEIFNQPKDLHPKVTTADNLDKYSCECKKVEDRPLCPKHARV